MKINTESLHELKLIKYNKKIIISIIITLWALSFKAYSITFSELPKYEDLINSTSLIVEGVVISSKTERKKIISHQWSKKGSIKYSPSLIITEYQIEVSRILKGKTKTSILKVWAPFGCFEGKCIVQDNSFKLEKGNQLIFFLNIDFENSSESEPIFWVNGHSLGLFTYKFVNDKEYIENYYFKDETLKSITYSKQKKSFEKSEYSTRDITKTFKLMTTVESLLEMINEN